MSHHDLRGPQPGLRYPVFSRFGVVMTLGENLRRHGCLCITHRDFVEAVRRREGSIDRILLLRFISLRFWFASEPASITSV